ncbi:serine/threonine protein kinase [Nocardia sp. NBC_01499]|uniref:serine/threonine-protein kinase n=1 Tax=Nocardia sp. NBC_01499 TaxID=2903597 RepID=UPI003869EA81
MVPRYEAAAVAAALGLPAVEFLAAGAFGDTWRADGRAVKIICDDGYPPERVMREVAGLSRVDSPYVVKLLETGVVHLGGTDRPALTFEYISGGDLGHKVAAGIRPTSAEALELLRGLLTGLRDLHDADGTVHRDIKPENIALRHGNWNAPVILDLGLAKSVSEKTVTVYPGFLGTWPWASPEQHEGKPARKTSDLFSVGATVRYAITGEHPFFEAGRSYTIDEVLAAIEAGPKPLPSFVSPQVGTVLDRLVRFVQNERGSTSSNLKKLAGQS